MLLELREIVARRADAGEPLDLIEREVVEPAPLDEDRRAALWLFAWGRVEGVASVARPPARRAA